MTRRTQIVVLAAVLVAAPAALAGWNELALRRGEHVLLRTQPVDPRDPFRGDYVALAYPESRLRPGAEFAEGTRVYVQLRERPDGVWVGRAPTRERPSAGVFVRGRVDGFQIRFGIERFYVREGTARKYELANARGRLLADVAVERDGSAHLSELVIR